MRLGEEIVISLRGEDIVLHPSLRRAMILERREGSFAGLVHALRDGSFTATRDIIALHRTMPFLEAAILEAGITRFQDPCIRFVLACAGMDLDHKPERKDKTPKSIPFSEYLTTLFRIGTGWLGWTPAETLDATPFEIMEAREGRIAMIQAIFGKAEEPEPEQAGNLDEKFRTALGSFGTVKVQRRKLGA